MMQPRVTNAVVAKPNSSAPSKRGNHHIAPGLELAVGFHGDAAAQIIEHQRLMRFRQAELPGQAGMFDAGLRRRAGAAVMTADQHDVGMAFGHARGDGADADFGNQLDADARMVIGVLQIVNQLRQIFDRIDIVVRRWRNQADPRGRVAHLGDPRINFSSGQLAAFARLGALRHLDLQFPCLRQIIARHAEAARCHLLDRAVLRIAVGLRNV